MTLITDEKSKQKSDPSLSLGRKLYSFLFVNIFWSSYFQTVWFHNFSF